jgi:hypothetical protein
MGPSAPGVITPTHPVNLAAPRNSLTNTGIYEKQIIGLWVNQRAPTPEIEEFNGNPLEF